MGKNANAEIQSSHDDIPGARQLDPLASAANAVPRADYCLAQLSDSDLLANTRRLVGRSNQLFAALLAHLAEVEARGVHRTRACSSLYTYCIYELRMSEDAAFRRATAAKLVKRFPALFDAIASGELHLTGLLMLGPHLTAANLVEVLARAKHRTKKETEQAQALEQLPTTEQAQALEQLPATEQAQAFAQLPATEPLELPAQRGRYIPAATRRAVFERDRGRCGYVDAFAQACRETHGLELHHLRAFARAVSMR